MRHSHSHRLVAQRSVTPAVHSAQLTHERLTAKRAMPPIFDSE